MEHFFFAPPKKLGFKCSKHGFLMWILLSILQNNIKLGDCYSIMRRVGWNLRHHQGASSISATGSATWVPEFSKVKQGLKKRFFWGFQMLLSAEKSLVAGLPWGSNQPFTCLLQSMANPPNIWRFLAGKIVQQWTCSIAMFDHSRAVENTTEFFIMFFDGLHGFEWKSCLDSRDENDKIRNRSTTYPAW